MNPKHPPGSDLMAKLMLRDPIVIDMIVTTVIGPEARSLYSSRPTEWSNRSRSDVIYAASVSSDNLPPVLVEVQHTINLEFIDRLLNYALCVKKDFKAKPVVVVFGVDATRNDVTSDFEPTSYSFMKQIPCKYWAERCYILDRNTIEEDTRQAPFHPMLALEFFFSSQKLSLMSIEHRDDPTIQSLYGIAKEQMKGKIAGEQSTASVLLEVCDQTNLQFKKILNVLQAMPDTLLRKRAYTYADDGISYTHACKRLCSKRSSPPVSPMPVPLELPEPALQLINEATSFNNSSTHDILRAELDIPKSDMEYVR
ncbi:hypothetical protein DFQ28_003112, partial [Apophysomyces sp. BC1034]